jgi:crotonobetainyl-CoA:carnitine CoA-transferase CaiB-like acyl-CoA transferase
MSADPGASDGARLGPFAGLRVVDLSDRFSGAFAARLFGDFGADVALCESRTGHVLRAEPPFLPGAAGPDISALHAFVNWNKRSASRDDKALDPLVAAADVVVTDAQPLDSALFSRALGHLRGNAVHLSITPHGLATPLTGVPGNNLTASARTGWSSINGYRDEPPVQQPRNQASYIGGLAGFVAAAAALRRRDESPTAELVDVSEVEAFALTVHPWGVAGVYETGTAVADNRPPRGRPGPLFETADGCLTLAVAYFRRWPDAMTALGLPEFAAREDLFDDNSRHTKDLTEVTAAVVRNLASLDRWYVFHALAALRCPVGVLQDVASLLADPQLDARDYYADTAVGGRVVRAPGRLARTEPPLWHLSRAAPELSSGPAPGPAATDSQPDARDGSPQSSPDGMAPSVPDAGPLSGLRVLSFGQAWSGAFGTELLALLGADVVQVSSLRRHDSWRRAGAGVPKAIADPSRTQHPLNTQGLFNSVNLNKREIALDLTSPRGRELLWRLIPRFSVLVDNYRPGVMSSWGVTMERLAELRPGMIWASVSGYGADGPYSAYPAIGTTIEPMAGLSSLHGYEGEPGMNTGGLYPDPVAAYMLAATILAALRERDRSGAAQRIDLSMMESLAVVSGESIVGYQAAGRIPGPIGNHHPRIAPHNNYAALGGEWVALSADHEAAWQALVEYIGDERLRDPRFETMAARKSDERVLDAILAEWCARHRAADIEAALGSLGVCAARVAPLRELYSRPDPAMVASGFVTSVDHPEVGPSWLPGAPWRLSGLRPAIWAAPCVGQHSQEILAAELGIGEAEYEALVADAITGVLGSESPEQVADLA